MKIQGTIIALILLALAASPAVAQDNSGQLFQDGFLDEPSPSPFMMLAQGPAGDDRSGFPPGPPEPGEFGKRRKHLEQLRMLKMLELLNLNEEQEVPFLAAFNDVRRRHRELESEIESTLEKLSRSIETEDVDDGNVYRLVDRVVGLEQQKHEITKGFLTQTREMLTAEQYAKLVIFHKRFEVELLERLSRFREHRGQGQGRMKNGN